MENKHYNHSGTLLALDGENGTVIAVSTDGLKIKTLVSDCGGTPDGIAIDTAGRHIYWTNMGDHYDQNDGFIERSDFDGANRQVLIPPGKTFTPKQLKLDLDNGFLYWCDREGMRVMRSRLDGSNITILVQTGTTAAERQDETNHCVGIAIDPANNYIYWTQKGPSKAGKGRIFRAALKIPANHDPLHRQDIELLWGGLPEPIDLDLDTERGVLYWTDRGAPPKGNTLNRADISLLPHTEPEILADGLEEAIGMALDLENHRVFFGDLGGTIYERTPDCPTKCLLYKADGRFTGIAYLNEDLFTTNN